MERTKPKRIGEILEEVLKYNDMDVRLAEVRAAEAWPDVVGENLARLTGKPFVRDGLLTVRVPSAALRNELWLHRAALIKAVCDAVNVPGIVTEIRLLG